MTHINRGKIIAVLSLTTTFLIGGCSVRTGDLTLVSTKNIDLSDIHIDTKTGQRYSGEDCKVNFLGIPFGIPNLKDAVDKALEAGKGNLMVDEVTYVKAYTFLIGGVNCIEVKGTVLNGPIKGQMVR